MISLCNQEQLFHERPVLYSKGQQPLAWGLKVGELIFNSKAAGLNKELQLLQRGDNSSKCSFLRNFKFIKIQEPLPWEKAEYHQSLPSDGEKRTWSVMLTAYFFSLCSAGDFDHNELF